MCVGTRSTQRSQELFPITEHSRPPGDRSLRNAHTLLRSGAALCQAWKRAPFCSVKAARLSPGSSVCFLLLARMLVPAPKWPQASAHSPALPGLRPKRKQLALGFRFLALSFHPACRLAHGLVGAGLGVFVQPHHLITSMGTSREGIRREKGHHPLSDM